VKYTSGTGDYINLNFDSSQPYERLQNTVNPSSEYETIGPE